MSAFWKNNVLREVDGFGLGIFRAIFGAFMVFELSYFQSAEFIELGIIAPIGTFSYDFLEWIQPLSLGSMKAVMLVLTLSALCIALGILFRPACILFTIGFSYLLFLGKGHYNNHFYLFCLIAFYLCFTKADRCFSVRKSREGENNKVPYWNYQVFRVALFITYFYGGLAKLNHDWLVCQQPVKTLVGAYFPGSFLDSPFMIGLVNYGGVLFDLGIGFLLFFKKTRLLALVGVLAFNLLNGLVLFDDIGIFPFVMISATIIFFDPEGKWIQMLREKLARNDRSKKRGKNQGEPKISYAESSPGLYVLIGFFIIQLLLPFRPFLLPGETNWTGIGRKFSWRMKIQTRDLVDWKITAVISETGARREMPQQALLKMINTMQFRYMAENPVMVWQFAQYLNEKNIREQGYPLEVYADFQVSYNGREPQGMIDPEVDLVKAVYDPLGENKWILPLTTICE